MSEDSKHEDRLCVVRCDKAGLFVEARFLGYGELPGEIWIEARRLHSWSSGALACGDVAIVGVTAGSLERRCERAIMISDICERIYHTPESLAAIALLPDWTP